ncbi:uncharacterized protein PAC_11218 [Phialocephala subalpina]|uniref:C2H2-type domain-containing protein n=1 Tax=Phialocephala subalpina TaxID=576137 RepID=A0A1L7X8I7_9HELO|nr:uncharacterized protein PAC_11218 [Phialocephala subalpina]
MHVAFNFPMSFRDRHHFLHDAYNSFQDPEEISAKRLESISQTVGLTMEEVMSWFVDEKSRRAKLLATHSQPENYAREFPLSPESMTSPESSTTATLTSSPTSPGSPRTFSGYQNIFSVLSSPTPSSQQRPSIAARGRRGRRPKTPSTHANLPSSSEPKRQKLSSQYPCTDCGKELLAERWSEHMKRVHFPDNVWECPKTNDKTRRPCCADPFYRSENFATHLNRVHQCAPDEVSQLKVSCKYAVSDFFHKICGICGDDLKSRDQSLDHIRDHFKEISQRPFPPTDLGASEWRENCGSDHVLQRGIHYRFMKQASQEASLNGGHGEDEGPDRPGPSQGDNHGCDTSRDQREGPKSNGDPSDKDYDAAQHNGPGATAAECLSICDILPTDPNTSNDTQVQSQPNPGGNTDDRLLEPPHQDPMEVESHFLGKPSYVMYDYSAHVWPHPGDPSFLEYTWQPSEIFQNESLSFVDPELRSSPSIVGHLHPQLAYPEESSLYPSPTPGFVYSSSASVRTGSNKGPYLYSPYPSLSSRPSLRSTTPYSAADDGNFSSEESHEKGRCPHPDCGKMFKDLKAHMLTHQNERPEKCPIATCDYSIKGFARKYDKNRHTLTHYRGTMVCGFCPGSGSPAEKSFNRADVFKRHLTSVHGVEQTPPNSRKKTTPHSTLVPKKLSGYAPDATGKCSTCSSTFENAQDFYEHLDDCVLRIVCQDLPSEYANAQTAHQKALGEYSRGQEATDVETPCNNLDNARVCGRVEGN